MIKDPDKMFRIVTLEIVYIYIRHTSHIDIRFGVCSCFQLQLQVNNKNQLQWHFNKKSITIAITFGQLELQLLSTDICIFHLNWLLPIRNTLFWDLKHGFQWSIGMNMLNTENRFEKVYVDNWLSKK